MSSRRYRIVILGGGGVGKSSLTVRFCFGNFTEKYDPTIEDVYVSTMEVEGRHVTLEIMDTAGTEQFLALQSMYMKSGDGYILAFAINSAESFQEISNIRTAILRERETNGQTPNNVPMILVGNKADLVTERAVPRDVGKALASHLNMPYLETSAKKGVNVEEIFQKITKLILIQEQQNGGMIGGPGGMNGNSMRDRKRKGRSSRNGPCVIC